MDPQARIILEEAVHSVYDAGYGQRIYRAGKSACTSAAGRDLQPVWNISCRRLTRFWGGAKLFSGQHFTIFECHRAEPCRGYSMFLRADRAVLCKRRPLAGRIDAALVGSVSLLLSPSAHRLFGARHILNENGVFHIFDRESAGEVLGEGAGAVLSND